jgi:ABC-type dipeptide/oligopeptide/nickel transport system permease subunit
MVSTTVLEDRADQVLPQRGVRRMRFRINKPRLTTRIIVGLLIIATVVVISICAPLLAPYSP